MRKMLVIVALLGSPMALANDIHPNMDAQAILKQQQDIRAEVDKSGGRFKHLTQEKRESLFASQGTVTSLLKGRRSMQELSEVDRIAAFNALENIEGILNQAEGDRMVCERMKPIGSNRPKTVCLTVAERRAAREQAQKDVSNRTQSCFKGQDNCI
ncbi:hypothetical protein J2X02_001183 [Pseudoxanthomonas japonensis]|uniref:hypothetical protein n=1 Tax=Pseudoxanthomonas TaxID=83618 RepID=UPI000783B34D|nr:MULTISPECIES: hypothetical protein [Pseudoxanthomonas]MBL8255199.1 hypothetical protein [Pseudoxanthomonas mexicana]MDR7068366.1 hypothetical protein [Pseudoxanthomonas japonensis]